MPPPGTIGANALRFGGKPVSGDRSVVVSYVLFSSETLKDDFCVPILKIFNISDLVLSLSDITNILNVFTICKFFDHFFAKKIFIPIIYRPPARGSIDRAGRCGLFEKSDFLVTY